MDQVVSTLLAQFHDFHAEVLRAKQRIAAKDVAAGPVSATTVQQGLVAVLERQSWASRVGRGDVAGELQHQAHYLMVALADEIFLNLDWAEREVWQGQLLEARLFGSHRSGEQFFRQLDELLERRDPMYSDLAQLYLLALALGFEGKWRGRPEAQGELALYRRRLFRLVEQRDPGLFAAEGPLVPQAYAMTLEEGRGRSLPYLARWGWVAVAVIGVWLVVGHWIWRALTEDLEPILGSILR
jgi:type VI secretion system protein ImpK